MVCKITVLTEDGTFEPWFDRFLIEMEWYYKDGNLTELLSRYGGHNIESSEYIGFEQAEDAAMFLLRWRHDV